MKASSFKTNYAKSCRGKRGANDGSSLNYSWVSNTAT